MLERLITVIVLIVFATGCQQTGDISTTPTTVPTAPDSTVPATSVNYTDVYRSVINAYIVLEQSEYTLFDGSILGDDVCLAPGNYGSYFIGYDPLSNKVTSPLAYAFYDLNGDGILELLIGADNGGDNGVIDGTNVFVTGIYGLQNGRPVSLIQVGAWSYFTFSINSDGNCFIKKTIGTHVDSFMEFFYKIDKDGTLITLDKLHIFFDYNFYGYDNVDNIPYSYTRDVNGDEVSITEQEYLALMQKYGSVGYLDTAGDLEANNIVINSWKSLTAYK